MIKMLKIGMPSMWHVHADGYATFVNSQSDAKIAAIWDDDTQRGQAVAEQRVIKLQCWGQVSTWAE